MKKILSILSLLLIITFSSCTTNTVNKVDLPIEVVTLKEKQQFDTLLVIKTEKVIYQFDKKREYVGAYKVENNAGTQGFVGGLMLIVLLFIFIGVVIS